MHMHLGVCAPAKWLLPTTQRLILCGASTEEWGSGPVGSEHKTKSIHLQQPNILHEWWCPRPAMSAARYHWIMTVNTLQCARRASFCSSPSPSPSPSTLPSWSGFQCTPTTPRPPQRASNWIEIASGHCPNGYWATAEWSRAGRNLRENNMRIVRKYSIRHWNIHSWCIRLLTWLNPLTLQRCTHIDVTQNEKFIYFH